MPWRRRIRRVPDLLATTPIAAPLPGLVPAVPLRAAPVSLPGTASIAADFSAALVGLLIPGATPKGKGERQAAAEGGKDLPVAPEAGDPLVAWLPEGLMPVALPAIVTLPDEAAPSPGSEAITQPVAVPETVSAPSVELPELKPGSDTAVPEHVLPAAVRSGPAAANADKPAPTPGPTAPALAVQPPASTPPGFEIRTAALQTAGPAIVTIEPGIEPDATDTVDVKDMTAIRGRFDVPPRDGVRPLPPAWVALQPAPVVQTAVTSGAAAQVFATAFTATTADPTQLDRVSDAAILLHGHARAEQATTVQAMSAGSQPMLDMTRDDWTGKMIDHIAALRDAAEAADTRIKLAPENLGALEVSIRRDGDRIHVHFTAENPAARQLIADAAPRLAELADARGLKLGQTSVDAGTGGGQQRDNMPQSASPARNATVASRAEPINDERIA
jgi:flagellar hook-length control protein FliK